MTSRIEQAWFYAGYVALSAAVGLSSGCSASAAQSSNVRGGDAASGGDDINTGAGGSSPSSAGSAQGGAGTIVVNQGGGMGGAATCGSDTQEAMTVPLSMFVLLDQSGSMTQDGNRWAPVTTALKAFIAGPSLAGVGVGLQYFPLGATMTSDPQICTATNYSTADVPLGDLPANGAALASSIDKHFFTAAMANDPAHWGTPTYPALQGSYEYLRGYLTANSSRRGVLLLATDGLPSKLCMGDTPAEIATLIASQLAMTPPIQTYVIGIGKITTLDTWAMAGGTGQAFVVDGTGTTTQDDLTKALNQIRVLTLPCDYPIPAPADGSVDPNKVNVRFTSPTQTATDFFNVANASACAAGVQTWYYDNPSAPTRVVMCPSACDALHQPGAKIELVFGCATEVYVPR
jgi:hypothetical protein